MDHLASLSTHPVWWMEALSSPGFSRVLAGPRVPVDGGLRIPKSDHHHLHFHFLEVSTVIDYDNSRDWL